MRALDTLITRQPIFLYQTYKAQFYQKIDKCVWVYNISILTTVCVIMTLIIHPLHGFSFAVSGERKTTQGLIGIHPLYR